MAEQAIIRVSEKIGSKVSDPDVIQRIVMVTGASSAGFILSSSGFGIIALAIVIAITIYVRRKLKDYKIIVRRTNELYVLLVKIFGLMKMCQKLSENYNFIINTDLLDDTIKNIHKTIDSLLDDDDRKKAFEGIQPDMFKQEESSVEGAADNNGVDQSSNGKDTNSKGGGGVLFKLTGGPEKFEQKLHRDTIRLGLYFSIMLGETMIFMNVNQIDMMKDMNTITAQNTEVKKSSEYKRIIYQVMLSEIANAYNELQFCIENKGMIKKLSELKEGVCHILLTRSRSEYVLNMDECYQYLEKLVVGLETTKSIFSDEDMIHQKIKNIVKEFCVDTIAELKLKPKNNISSAKLLEAFKKLKEIYYAIGNDDKKKTTALEDDKSATPDDKLYIFYQHNKDCIQSILDKESIISGKDSVMKKLKDTCGEKRIVYSSVIPNDKQSLKDKILEEFQQHVESPIYKNAFALDNNIREDTLLFLSKDFEQIYNGIKLLTYYLVDTSDRVKAPDENKVAGMVELYYKDNKSFNTLCDNISKFLGDSITKVVSPQDSSKSGLLSRFTSSKPVNSDELRGQIDTIVKKITGENTTAQGGRYCKQIKRNKTGHSRSSRNKYRYSKQKSQRRSRK